jgi:maltooligosyltrehalose trehalohydrolase
LEAEIIQQSSALLDRWRQTLGAVHLGDHHYQFRLWAPKAKTVQLHLLHPNAQLLDMQREEGGYFQVTVHDLYPGTRYFFRINGQDRPDPASHCQPEGVHGPSQIIPPDFPWEDAGWQGIPLEDYIFYELHVGVFTHEGTFDAIIPYLDTLKALGITAIELMPIAQFPGMRNWGYDGVYPYAPQVSYGDSDGLRRLINACHQRGLAIVLDVVYNHFGPEGNYVQEYGEYFTDAYKSAWGNAVNFDQEQSDEVRRFFIENALHWFVDFHVDALRLDATHTIMDFSAYTFLEQLSESVERIRPQVGRSIYLIAENAKNDVRTVLPVSEHGLGMDAQWNDDFHHALRTLMTCDQTGYYQDYGDLSQLAKAYAEGFYFSGQYSYKLERCFGTNSVDVPPERFVVFAYNHDQIGNRAYGERLGQYLDFDELKLAASVVILSPYLPLLFMGEEYNEPAPFLYFTDFDEKDVADGVRDGREKETAPSNDGEDETPNPESYSTFFRCKLNFALHQQRHHGILWRFYQKLIYLRKTIPALRHLSKQHIDVTVDDSGHVMIVRRWHENSQVLAFYNFHNEPAAMTLPVGSWALCLDSGAAEWSKDGANQPAQEAANGDEQLLTLILQPKSAVLFTAKRDS